MKCLFVQIRCRPGTTYEVADRIYEREIASELYSTSGEWDLLAKLYLEPEVDVGEFINTNLLDIPNIVRSLTTITFRAF